MRYGNAVPSNYRPLPRVRRTPGTSPSTVPHDRMVAGRMTGVLHFQIQAVDAMRVGDGSLAVSRGGLVHDLVRHRNRRPLIPGSTVKGVVRNLVEALGGGCDLDGSCSPLCIACSLFGTIEGQTWRGRVGFDDALAPQKIKLAVLRLPRAFSPRKAVGRRVYGPASPGAAETMPHFAVLSGAIFEARMHFINLDEGEFGLLLSALGVGKGFCPRFGGGGTTDWAGERWSPLGLSCVVYAPR